jgi:zeta-carotene isomerase
MLWTRNGQRYKNRHYFIIIITFDINKEEWDELEEQGWFTFLAAVGAIMMAVAVLWVYPPTASADNFLAFLEPVAGNNSHLVTLMFGILFPIFHSGLASLWPLGE